MSGDSGWLVMIRLLVLICAFVLIVAVPKLLEALKPFCEPPMMTATVSLGWHGFVWVLLAANQYVLSLYDSRRRDAHRMLSLLMGCTGGWYIVSWFFGW